MTERIRALLDAARAGYEPSPEDRVRVKKALTATPAVVTANAAALGSGAPGIDAARSAGGAASATAIAGKILAASLVVAPLSFGAGFAAGRSTAPNATAAPTPSVSVTSAGGPAAIAPLGTAVLAPPAASEPSSVPSANSATSARPAASAGSTLWEEAALLREAQRALQGGDATACLSILDRLANKFPSGALGEERSALRVLALCGSGRVVEARALGAAFLARYPGSLHAGRVRASCASTDR